MHENKTGRLAGLNFNLFQPELPTTDQMYVRWNIMKSINVIVLVEGTA